MTTIAAGRYDRRMVVERNVEVQDPATGQITREWQEYLSRATAVRHLTGREFNIPQSIAANVDTEFLTRYDQEIRTVTADESFRIAYEARLYDVKYSQEDTVKGRRSSWRILARARTEEAA